MKKEAIWLVVFIAVLASIVSGKLLDENWRYIEAFASENNQRPEDNSPDRQLINAVGDGDYEKVLKSLSLGADPNAGDECSGYVLMYAAGSGRLSIVKALLDKGADINATSHHGETALKRAAYYGSKDVVVELIERGADLNVATNGDYFASGGTVLIAASKGGHVPIIEYLVEEQGLGVNTTDTWRGTPVMLAANNGRSEAVKYLLGHGADVNRAEQGGNTALIFAARAGFTNIDVDLTVNSYNKATKDSYIETVRLLLANGADVNARNNNGETALMIASKNGNTEIAKLLKQAGAKE